MLFEEEDFIDHITVIGSRRLAELLKKYENACPEKFAKANVVVVGNRVYSARDDSNWGVPVKERDGVKLYATDMERLAKSFFASTEYIFT
ncbi:MAG: hypothetical protein WA064_01135 [Candidatus Moraniibacteriota bacterium]